MSDRITQIVVIDDHPIFRDGVIYALSCEADFRVVGEGESADDAILLCRDARPDLALIDMTMPGGGVQAITRIRVEYPSIRILVLTVEDGVGHVTGALGAGAHGYLLKGVGSAELVEAVRQVARGGTYVPPVFAAKLLHARTQEVPPQPMTPAEPLTEREEEILDLLGQGRSNREIGLKLGLAEKTVKWHVTSILEKLGVENRLQAAMFVSGRKN
ncbi:response regulator [Microvirga pudoricolor]|uniref:response regulator n=1 Tax=Microvirga pudoricolor TaxID=2778729 RepID=UPI00195043EB|nr:response regulator transcription factor [Microvirga pudoricolor]MBM6596400.1 response regulator transcription factor [Microvirga pudoricolor]